MSEIAPRHGSLRLNELSTPENLASREGRAAIRAGYSSFSRLIDDMDSFDRAEEVRVGSTLSEATSGFPPGPGSGGTGRIQTRVRPYFGEACDASSRTAAVDTGDIGG